MTDLSHLKDKDKIKVTAAVVAGEPEPTMAYDFEAARPYLAEMFGWLGTRSRQYACKSWPFQQPLGQSLRTACLWHASTVAVVGRILIWVPHLTDMDCDGRLKFAEFKRLVQYTGVKLPGEQWQALC
eukprot:COSAG01_NODE_41711_length_448_cov_0.868195_1_plen_126_part_01